MRVPRLWLTFVVSILTLSAGRSVGLADANSREGCMNQWLFNGVWRVQVTSVEPFMDGGKQVGWQVTEVWRNGTSLQLSPTDSFLDNQRLELTNGSIAATDSTAGTMSQQGLAFNNFAPAGQFTYKQTFYVTNVDPSNKPKGLEVMFDASKLVQMKTRPQFSSSRYNFHFKLDCVATGQAAQAQGGSTQIAATGGCLNQWLSNGIWKIRVTAIESNTPDAPQNQYGWRVTQTWVNASGRGVVPRSYDDQGGKFAPTNVLDEYLVTQGGNNASTSNVAGGFQIGTKPGYDWAPGDSYTFSQLFAWSQFDRNDKPVRLLVTFDEKAQNKVAGIPHYRTPANFRIDLTCTK